MKKYIFVFLIVAVLVCSLPISIYAENEGINVSTVDTVGADAEHDLFSRVWEYFNDNTNEVLTVAGNMIIVAFGIFTKLRNDKKTTAISEDVKAVKKSSSAQTAVVGVVNQMVDGYKGMKESYEKYQTAEDDRNKLIGAVMVQNTALLEILNTVYVNNKNLPQGVKDLVNLKYANCLKALENDEVLSAIVESVREKVGSGIGTGEGEGVTETSEV